MSFLKFGPGHPKSPSRPILRLRYLENLKYNVKRTCIFHLIFVGILPILTLVVKNKGW